MARIRTIKPSFFTDRNLASCGRDAMLLFAGLWCLADREGRLIDAPKFIAGQIFPHHDDVDCGKLLDKLAEKGIINRYEVGTEKYIEVVNFAEHQKPNSKESQSVIPPNKHVKRSCRAREKKVSDTKKNRVGTSYREGEGEREQVPSGDGSALIVEKYNSICVPAGLPQCLKLSDKRLGFLRSRISENPEFDWATYFTRVSKSKFLTGHNDRGWRADFEWLIRPENFLKVNEGKYDNRDGPKPKTRFEEEFDRSTDTGNREVARTRQMLKEIYGDTPPFQEKVKP